MMSLDVEHSRYCMSLSPESDDHDNEFGFHAKHAERLHLKRIVIRF